MRLSSKTKIKVTHLYQLPRNYLTNSLKQASALPVDESLMKPNYCGRKSRVRNFVCMTRTRLVEMNLLRAAWFEINRMRTGVELFHSSMALIFDHIASAMQITYSSSRPNLLFQTSRTSWSTSDSILW